MQRILSQKITTFLLGILFIMGASAHTVDQFYMELYPEEKGFKAVLYADAAYCLPEYRGDDGKEAPDRSWLLARNDEEHARLRQEAEHFVRESLGFMLDEKPLEYRVSFPDYDSNPYDFYQALIGKAILRIEVLGAYLPTGGSLQVDWKDEFQANLLIDIVKQGIDDEERSILQVDWEEGGSQMDLGLMVYPFEVGQEVETEFTKRQSWFTFVGIGFAHIVPMGLDHILFVIGLFLFSPAWRPLLHQSLAFTVAHSLTLALSLMGVMSFSGKWVEVLIALSIVFIAVENIWFKKLHKHRIFIVFAFGLLHGLGFGAVLQEFLPTDRIFFPLVGFNLGVELGQVMVLAVCFLIFWRFREKFHPIRVAGSVIIALIGSYWVIERI